MRKGIIEVGFSWIFILIAGIVILGLFTYIGVSQGNFFRDLLSQNLLIDLNAIFIGAQVSKNTAAVFEIPKSTLDFDCDSYGIGGISHPVSGRFVYAPKNIETSEIITWSKPWSLGFRVTNFLYVTSPYVKYYIAYDPSVIDLANEIYDDLPPQLVKEKIEFGSGEMIKDENYDRIVVLVLGKDPYSVLNPIFNENEFREYENDEISFVYLTDNSGITETVDTFKLWLKNKEGDLQLFDGTVVDNQKVYDLASLYALYISGNTEIFQCTMARAYYKAFDVTQIYLARSNILLAQNMPVCDLLYTDAVNEFNTMLTNLNDNGRTRTDDLGVSVQKLDIYNTRLEQLSCPLLY